MHWNHYCHHNYCLKPKEAPGKAEVLGQMNFDDVSGIVSAAHQNASFLSLCKETGMRLSSMASNLTI